MSEAQGSAAEFPEENRNAMNDEQTMSDADTTSVFTPINVVGDVQPLDFADDEALATKKKRSLLWLWIPLTIVVVLAAIGAGGVWFFQSHTLPGVKLWGTSMLGRTQSQIAAKIDQQVSDVGMQVSYNDMTVKVSLEDLGLSVDSDAIASEVFEAKRDLPWWQQFAFWNTIDIADAPFNAKAAVADALNEKLDIEEAKPVDASVRLNADGTGFETVAAQQGEGLGVTDIAEEMRDVIESFGSHDAQTIALKKQTIDPAVTDDIADQAKKTLNDLVANPIQITIDDHAIATLDAPALFASMRIDANDNAVLAKNETRNGYVVFNADKLQQYYSDSIKPNLKTGREDRETIVNNNGDVLETITEGHDGVTVADGADANIGVQGVEALANGGGNIEVEGTVDPMKEITTKRHVVVDLSDGKVYAYENDKLVKTMSMSAGEGNNRATGACTGDLCTPTGDFTIWLKYQSQDMSGNLTLSDGSTSQWDVKDVGFVNYFSKTGCAIHRIVSPMTDAQIAAMNANTSHGCVGIGWDVAEWFYGWCLYGTSVHVQQ